MHQLIWILNWYKNDFCTIQFNEKNLKSVKLKETKIPFSVLRYIL